jgi:hypothetical protein
MTWFRAGFETRPAGAYCRAFLFNFERDYFRREEILADARFE